MYEFQDEHFSYHSVIIVLRHQWYENVYKFRFTPWNDTQNIFIHNHARWWCPPPFFITNLVGPFSRIMKTFVWKICRLTHIFNEEEQLFTKNRMWLNLKCQYYYNRMNILTFFLLCLHFNVYFWETHKFTFIFKPKSRSILPKN